jgi:hypothetical protein
VLDGGFVDGLVQVGARLDGLCPGAIAAAFVDDGVDDFLLGGERAVSVREVVLAVDKFVRRMFERRI